METPSFFKQLGSDQSTISVNTLSDESNFSTANIIIEENEVLEPRKGCQAQKDDNVKVSMHVPDGNHLEKLSFM